MIRDSLNQGQPFKEFSSALRRRLRSVWLFPEWKWEVKPWAITRITLKRETYWVRAGTIASDDIQLPNLVAFGLFISWPKPRIELILYKQSERPGILYGGNYRIIDSYQDFRSLAATL